MSPVVNKSDKLLSGAEMIIRFLVDEGIENVYGYPGGALLHIYDALYQQDDVKHILVRHEQAATHMADGYARATGKPGVVLVTSGPGSTNAITGIATAHMDSIPMVVIAGQVMSTQIGEDAFQETDMVGLTRPIAKHNLTVSSVSDIPQVLKKAFHIASTGRPGPVIVVVPKDMTLPEDKHPYRVPGKIQLRSYRPNNNGHIGQIKKAIDLMLSAKRPVILAGGGVITAECSELVIELAKRLKAPVINTLMGLGGYPATDPQFIGMLGLHGHYTANMAMHHSDLIINLGSRLDDRITNAPDKFCPTAKLIHIDIDPTTISKIVKADIPIVGSLDFVLPEMIARLDQEVVAKQGNALSVWWDQIVKWRAVEKEYDYKDEVGVIKPQQAIEAVYNATKGNAFVCSDVGQHQMFAAQYYKFDMPRRWINSGGLGTMGFGLPAAMGVKLNLPEEEVVCITGEGSIQMNIQELSTCSEYDLALKIICLNNESLGMVRQLQDLNYSSRHSHSYMYSLPNFMKLAEAYGHVGLEVRRIEDLDDTLELAFSIKDRLVFVNIYVDPAEHVHPTQIPRGSMRDMWVSQNERT